jgi:hypothetical protein
VFAIDAWDDTGVTISEMDRKAAWIGRGSPTPFMM